MRKLLPFLAFFIVLSLSAQENGHFLVELEPRTPDVEAMVQAFEGTKAIPIMANNLNGKSISITDYKGKTVILWFWNTKCERCIQEIQTLNTLQSELPNLEIISFADEPTAEMKEFVKNRSIDFNVIPNSKIISEGPYSGELGYPKMFFVDQSGTIKWVFPSKDFLSPKFDLYNIVKTLYMQLNQ